MINKNILQIKNLNFNLNEKKILNNLSLSINENEIHIIMGPNGSGKSTLAKILVGHPIYSTLNITGEIFYFNENLLSLSAEIRAHKGLFLAFQNPIEISGVTNYDFLKLIYNQKLKYNNEIELTSIEFLKKIEKLLYKLRINYAFLNRNLNEGFSGGEKKLNEILQMLLLEPKLIILDEIDSGLDIDILKLICKDILNNLSKKTSLLVITHNPKVVEYLKPKYLHIFINGKIVKTGTKELINQLNTTGYNFFN